MKKYILTICALIASIAFSTSTYATTLDFTSGTYGTTANPQFVTSYTQDGYLLAPQAAGNHMDLGLIGDLAFHNGDQNTAQDNNIILTFGSGAFNLTSIDIAGFGYGGTQLDLFGSNGAMQSITTTGMIALSAFSNVTSVMFSMLEAPTTYAGVGFNGMEVSAVPVPAAAWLFGSALLGFFGFSRKKANA